MIRGALDTASITMYYLDYWWYLVRGCFPCCSFVSVLLLLVRGLLCLRGSLRCCRSFRRSRLSALPVVGWLVLRGCLRCRSSSRCLLLCGVCSLFCAALRSSAFRVRVRGGAVCRGSSVSGRCSVGLALLRLPCLRCAVRCSSAASFRLLSACVLGWSSGCGCFGALRPPDSRLKP